MAELYARLRRELSPKGFATVSRSQREWLRRSRTQCLPGRKTGSRTMSAEEAVGCLTEQYEGQLNALDIPVKVAGGLRLEGRLRDRYAKRPTTFESERYPWLVGTPAGKAAAFNQAIFKRLKLDQGLFAASGLEPTADLVISYDRWYQLHRFDQQLVSIEFYVHHEANFGHGWREEFAFNWNLAQDRPLALADLFQGDEWSAAIARYAIDYLSDQGDVAEPRDLADESAVSDPGAWLFGDADAVLMLGYGERSMAGASAEVPIPYDVLAPYLRPDAPLSIVKKPE